jgi:hypothetical protein
MTNLSSSSGVRLEPSCSAARTTRATCQSSHSARSVVVALTLRSDGRHEDDGERQEQVILHQAPRRRPKVQLAIVKRIVETGHLRRGVIRRHAREDLVHLLGDVLSRVGLEQRGKIRVEERVVWQVGPARGGVVLHSVDVVGQVVHLAVVDGPLPARVTSANSSAERHKTPSRLARVYYLSTHRLSYCAASET